ncbi:peptidase M48 [Halteromyces radiatus]|uniref:peptidase M48 n=1 Tax=Halteromyces radiatus TaxID=101107 RepID=UPI00221F70A9|nr:peptidase M48 [Halteromyces radiatus]KAI8084799.1 peptidase M48 [Halteromyces radiatus]
MAREAYSGVMAQFGHRILPRHHPYTQFVSRVAKRLIRVSGMDNVAWEFYVIDSPEQNAFVLPGGKVFVFTGILPVVENEDGMAAVLGHEISHQVARHSSERFSFEKVLLAIQFGLLFFGIDPRLFFNHLTMNLMMLKPFSRKCEREADTMGLELMAQACFDPTQAVNVWRRMEASGTARGIPEFASTHPSHKNRISYLQEKVR